MPRTKGKDGMYDLLSRVGRDGAVREVLVLPGWSRVRRRRAMREALYAGYVERVRPPPVGGKRAWRLRLTIRGEEVLRRMERQRDD